MNIYANNLLVLWSILVWSMVWSNFEPNLNFPRTNNLLDWHGMTHHMGSFHYTGKPLAETANLIQDACLFVFFSSSHSYFCLQCLMFIMLTYASILSMFSISYWSLLSSSSQCSSLPSSALIFTFIRGTNKFLYTFLGVHRLQNDLVPHLSASWVK
jgi:hypothetical protein